MGGGIFVFSVDIFLRYFPLAKLLYAYNSKVICAIALLKPQSLNSSNAPSFSLRGPNVLFSSQIGIW